MKKSYEILRILDANLNRSREGLRVCEEISRFVLANPVLTKRLKKIRHQVSDSIQSLEHKAGDLLRARDVRTDVGKKASKLENSRGDWTALFLANAQRAKESLRALEEVSKMLTPALSRRYKTLRFRVYAIEKRMLPLLEALRDRRSAESEKLLPGRSSALGHSRRS